jgi:hypothetical protein
MGRAPNNSFKPNLLRYSKSVAEKACHAFASTTQVGLTQTLAVMERIPLLLIMIVLTLLGCATSQGCDYIYFKDLAQKTLSGNAAAFREVLTKAETTPPGEQLEELAEISSKFVLIDPVGFLRTQSAYKECFGVDFLGPDYVDNFQAAREEYDRRYNALESVTDPALAVVRDRCISTIDVVGDDS